MASAILRGLPEISRLETEEIKLPIAIVCSGPSLAREIEKIRNMQRLDFPVVAVRDAHDYLIKNGIVPDYALSVDPLPESVSCFENPNSDVHYMIASQCDPSMFDKLAGNQVTTFHQYFKQGQKEPKGKLLIAGGSTSGLRALSVFYVKGYRNFHIFGMDSCLEGQTLRINGTGKRQDDIVADVRLEPEGRVYWTTPSMALQAEQFEDVYTAMPDAQFTVHGDGLIAAIARRHQEIGVEFQAIETKEQNERVSFIHAGGESMASFRYRSRIPAEQIGASINDLTAGTLVFSKVRPQELIDIGRAKARGQRVIVDFCDDHFDWMHYAEALRIADAVTCCSKVMQEIIRKRGRDATVIPDPWEFPLEKPHGLGINLLWFGHATNRDSFQRILPDLEGYPLRVVSNFGGAIPWSYETMLEEFARANVVILPKTEDYKSANRCVEAIRQGCSVIAEPHPALEGFEGIYIGNIKEGLEWYRKQPLATVTDRILTAQSHLKDRYSPAIVGSAWRTITSVPITSDVEKFVGMAG